MRAVIKVLPRAWLLPRVGLAWRRHEEKLETFGGGRGACVRRHGLLLGSTSGRPGRAAAHITHPSMRSASGLVLSATDSVFHGPATFASKFVST